MKKAGQQLPEKALQGYKTFIAIGYQSSVKCKHFSTALLTYSAPLEYNKCWSNLNICLMLIIFKQLSADSCRLSAINPYSKWN